MRIKIPLRRCLFFFVCSLASPLLYAQFEGPPLGEGPWLFDSYEEESLKVSVLARHLDHPFGMVFLPETATVDHPLGDILFTERRTGKIRLYRKGSLHQAAVGDLTGAFPMEQLFDIKLHPRYQENKLLYFTYIKEAPHPNGTDDYWVTTALARAKWDGEHVVEAEEIFEARAWSGNFGGASSRLHFLDDGTLLFAVSHRINREAPQSLMSHIGKVLRLNDDGSVPGNNPFVAVEGALPEIYTWGNRSVMDFATHPLSGEIWELENGPQGGDEVNVLKPGLNYGWPLVTYGRDYDGTFFNSIAWVEGTERPELFWVPSITVAGMSFYTGDVFPNWKDSLFVTSMITGRVPGTGHLERIVFNEHGEIRREQMLNALKQRIRYVSQGPDGLLYLLTDHSDGVLLRIAPLGWEEGEPRISDGHGDDLLQENPLFTGQDCLTCHRYDGKLVGPSFREIAARYRAGESSLNQLAEKIIVGGGGNWGEVQMLPHPDLNVTKAKEIAAWILEQN